MNWRVKRNKNENPENMWQFNILRQAVTNAGTAQVAGEDMKKLYEGGMSVPRVAEMMGISESTVYRVLTMAKTRMRK
ncbi:helix-turn-helix domain-containing protein, partial [Rhizobiaceae sp. 2RAB30]